MSLLSKFKNVHLVSLMTTGGMSALIFLFTAILFRSLTVSDLGIWFFFTTYISFLDTFRQGFLSTAFIKFFAGTTEGRGREVIGSTWHIASMITLIFVLINLPLLFFLDQIGDDSLKYFFKYFSINLIFSLPMILSMCIAQAKLRFDHLMYIRLCQVSLLIGLLCVIVYLEIATLDNLMYVNLLSSFGTSLLCIAMGWSGIRFYFFKKKETTREIFDFGKYTVGTSISTNLFGLTDTTVMNFMIGPSALAVYNLGKKFMELIEIPLRSFTATAMPTLSAAFNRGDKNELINTMKKYIGIVTIAIIPIVIISFTLAPFLMSLIGGGQYKNTSAGNMAVVIFRISLIFSLLSPADRFSAIALDAIHKPQVNFYKVIIMVIVNVIVDIIGVYVLGNVYGVVVGTIFVIITAIYIANKYLQDYSRFVLLDAYTVGFVSIKKFILDSMHSKKTKD